MRRETNLTHIVQNYFRIINNIDGSLDDIEQAKDKRTKLRESFRETMQAYITTNTVTVLKKQMKHLDHTYKTLPRSDDRTLYKELIDTTKELYLLKDKDFGELSELLNSYQSDRDTLRSIGTKSVSFEQLKTQYYNSITRYIKTQDAKNAKEIAIKIDELDNKTPVTNHTVKEILAYARTVNAQRKTMASGMMKILCGDQIPPHKPSTPLKKRQSIRREPSIKRQDSQRKTSI